MYASLFISYLSSLKRGILQISDFLKICKFIVFAYAFTLVIQQMCVLLGMPILNVSNYNPAHPWKLNALSAEPSHSARIISVVMLSYLIATDLVKETKLQQSTRNEKIRVWAAYLWCMLTLGSATGAIMLMIVVLYGLGRNNVKAILASVLAFLVALLVFPDEQMVRATNLFTAFLSLDYDQILMADHSGGLRIAPLLFLFEKVEIFSMTGLFGHGIDSVGLFMSDYIGGVEDGYSAGGLMVLWYEYGFVSFAFFAYFSIRTMYIKGMPLCVLVWALMVLIAGVNGQMIWLSIILLTTLRFFKSRIDLRSNFSGHPNGSANCCK